MDVRTPITGSIVKIDVSEGERVINGQSLVVIEVMKMETVISAQTCGLIKAIYVKEGDVCDSDQVLMNIDESVAQSPNELSIQSSSHEDNDLLDKLSSRRAFLFSEGREAVKKRLRQGKQTARKNIEQLVDKDSFVEYGGLAVAAQRSRRSLQSLIEDTPADGIITGFATINSSTVLAQTCECLILAYDFTVLAGTQGMMGHKKTDRMLKIAIDRRSPVILLGEGGGGRPGDTDFVGVGGLDVMTFYLYGRLQTIKPRIAIVSGYCFAGNAALVGSSDIIIIDESTSMGMGGPAMIEGGGLGVHDPMEVGPAALHHALGIADVLTADERESIEVAKKCISYFQGNAWVHESGDQSSLRSAIPSNRKRTYELKPIIETIADIGSFQELKDGFAPNVVTGLIRIGGKPMGLIANNNQEMGGAIDAKAAQKIKSMLELCDRFDLPILSLCDTPGFMVGPDAEKEGMVRDASVLFNVGSRLKVSVFTIVLRKGYGLGSMAMAGGSFHTSQFIISWPTGEFGGMGLEGAVKLGFKKELEAIDDLEARESRTEELIAKLYKHGQAINAASLLEIDDVIDPADTRKWILFGLQKNNMDKKI